MRRIFLLFFAFSISLGMYGQMTELAFEASVKGIDEFMSRFNGYERHLMVDPKATDAVRQNLLTLFDAENTQDVELKLAMVDTILSRGTQLSYESKMWYAEATCKMFYKKQEVELKLILRTELTPNNLSYWGFAGVDGMIKAGIIDTTQWRAVSPVEHEINFIGLESIINKNREHFAGYRCRDIQIDELSAFLALVQAGDLTFDYCEGVRYHFLNVPGFIFTVENQMRTSTNSGWLISDVMEADFDEKENYMFNVLKLRQWYMEKNSY